jgi:hypothetical protein
MASATGDLALVDLASGTRRRAASSAPFSLARGTITMSDDGRRVAAVLTQGASTVVLWDTELDRAERVELAGWEPRDVALSPDGRTLVVAGFGLGFVFDVADPPAAGSAGSGQKLAGMAAQLESLGYTIAWADDRLAFDALPPERLQELGQKPLRFTHRDV